jgi:3-hydroxyacyl-[acyl-carrier-protein] dehydratase
MLDTRERPAADEASGREETPEFDVERIRDVLPHRYPFLLVDRILEFEPGKRVVGLKNISINEKFFKGHLPGHAIMPGSLLVEAMAQVGCVMLLSLPQGRGRLAYFGGIDKARFYRPVLPGDTVLIEVESIAVRQSVSKVRATARVEGQVVCDCELMCALVDRTRRRTED